MKKNKRRLVVSNQFRKDLKKLNRRGYNLSKLQAVVDKLANDEPLEVMYHDHNLVGDYIGFRECHIAPDWLLVYKKEDNELIMFLMRTGTHSDLF